MRVERIPLVGGPIRRVVAGGAPPIPHTVEYGDIIAGLPVPDGHCVAIYCSHVLEHLSREDCEAALCNTYRYLAPGGIFRLVVPDLRALAEAYLARTESDASHEFMERTVLGQNRHRPVLLRVLDAFRNFQHLWMWDFASLEAELQRIGFVHIRRTTFGDSSEPRFADVEDEARYVEPGFGNVGTLRCLGIECTKP